MIHISLPCVNLLAQRSIIWMWHNYMCLVSFYKIIINFSNIIMVAFFSNLYITLQILLYPSVSLVDKNSLVNRLGACSLMQQKIHDSSRYTFECLLNLVILAATSAGCAGTLFHFGKIWKWSNLICIYYIYHKYTSKVIFSWMPH